MAKHDLNAAPGLGPTLQADYRLVSLAGEQYLPGTFILDGSKARDLDNSVSIKELQAGLLIGRITSGKKFGASILGATGVLHDTSVVTTTMTLPADIVTEIQRRIGTSGTFKITGPPTANGTVVTETVTFSAIASSTTLTITATSADFAAGSFIQPNDGSETPVTLLPNGYPIKVVDALDDDRDVELPRYLTGGLIDSSQILNWPSDTSLQQWIVDQLNAVGQFVFDHQHSL